MNWAPLIFGVLMGPMAWVLGLVCHILVDNLQKGWAFKTKVDQWSERRFKRPAAPQPE